MSDRKFLKFQRAMIITQCGLWKFQNFSITQILREIIFKECRSSEISIFAILRALNFIDLVNSNLPKVQKFRVTEFVKMVDFETLDLLILISCKI